MIPFFHNAGQNSASGGSVDIGDNVAYSLMLDSASSQDLSRTFGTPTTQNTWTYSVWFKRGKLSAAMAFMFATGYDELMLLAADTIRAYLSATNIATSSAVYRDPGAFAHVVFSCNAGAMTIYVQNASVATGSGTAAYINKSGVVHRIGSSAGEYFDGYLADVIFVDGQALTPSSFGRTSADTGAWVHKTYAGTYGNNGFRLDFSEAGATAGSNAGLGKDVSGNGNYWTTNGGISSANQYIDTPTNNFCVLNRLLPSSQTNTPTLTLGNTKMAGGGANWNGLFGSLPIPTTGKWYWELKNNTLTNGTTSIRSLAIADLQSRSLTSGIYSAAGFYGWQFQDSRYLCNNGSNTTTASALADGAYAQIAVDCDNGKVYLGVANTWYSAVNTTTTAPDAGGTQTFTLNAGGYFPVAQNYNTTGSGEYNFGAGGSGTTYDSASGGYFKYTPPSGYKALSTANLTAPAILDPSDHFFAKTRTGTGASYSVTGLNFQPDLVWTKCRSNASTDHVWTDVVRGVTKQIWSSNVTGTEQTDSDGVTSFNSDGYSGGTGVMTTGDINTNTRTYIDWMFKGGNGTSSNTDGSITSTVSANTSAGISIVSYTGTGANATFGHGLSSVGTPKMVIIANRSEANNWPVYHTGLTSTSYYLELSTTIAQFNNGSAFIAPGSSTIAIYGSSARINKNTNNYIAYVFSEAAGFSKFGSYTGNASTDGVFVFTGFRPRFLMTKVITTTNDWTMYDSARNTYNVINGRVFADLSNAEDTSSNQIDFCANGFKVRVSTDPNTANTFIFAAFAETPFKYATAR